MPAVYQELAPGPRLARHIECYWFRQNAALSSHLVLPDGCVDILFERHGGEPAALNVVGLMTAPLDVPPRSGRFFFGVRFRPGMASAFLPESGQAMDRIEPLESFWGSAASSIFDRLAEATDPRAMAALMDHELRPAQPPGRAEQLLGLLPEGRSMDRLAQDLGVSARQLRRLCMERAGVPPKYLSRILRFRKTADRMLASGAQPSWAQFAVACGYYDQAHFIREFQEFARVTPDRFLQYRAAAGL